MAGSSTLPKFTIILGVIVFLVGLYAFVTSMGRGGGTDTMALIAMAVGLVGIVLGRRIIRKAGAGSRGS